MNGLDILNYISKDDMLLSRFGGLFAIDQLHFKLPQRDIFYICNTDTAKQKGKHWIVIYFPQHGMTIEYFDSLGKKPSAPFVKFMSQTNRTILFNTRRLQGISSKACGYYCLYFAFFRSRDLHYGNIIDNFSDSLETNEKYVIEFIKHSLM